MFFLNVRYKDRFFSGELKTQAREKLMDVLSAQTKTEPCSGEEMPGPSQINTDEPTEKSQIDYLSTMYSEILEESMEVQQCNSPIASQVHCYLSEATIPRSAPALAYWKSNKTRFPALAEAARAYLSAPCTSVDSERLFSFASNILTEKRNRLSSQNAEMLLFVKRNMPLKFNFKMQ